MATGDKIALTLLALFIFGIAGAAFDGLAWLWLCAPLVIVGALVAFAIWFANKQLRGLNIL